MTSSSFLIRRTALLKENYLNPSDKSLDGHILELTRVFYRCQYPSRLCIVSINTMMRKGESILRRSHFLSGSLPAFPSGKLLTAWLYLLFRFPRSRFWRPLRLRGLGGIALANLWSGPVCRRWEATPAWSCA